eukprot:TRINITY_DN12950_c0_g1_i1.p1 TRINITY_DN12950_c0_g1~~TRINITY_DN12950_c0_g1_i1.p1  ORF type:complete len:268 (+),score=49.38 TRINITY_DN12950_c0_g1_i1:95-898(+)
MAISLNDEARLPPVVPSEELHEKHRREDVRNFRKYLVETGTIKGFVELYKHTFKHEMRLDNPELLNQFFAAYQQHAEGSDGSQQVAQENSTLREDNATLSKQAEELATQLREQRGLAVARAFWQSLSSSDFWEFSSARAVPSNGLTLSQIYERFCGSQTDTATRVVLADLVRPWPFNDERAASTLVTYEAFCDWVLQEMSDDFREMLRAELLPRLKSAPRDAPFETELTQAIRECEQYPAHLDSVVDYVELDECLRAFLDAAAARFA